MKTIIKLCRYTGKSLKIIYIIDIVILLMGLLGSTIVRQIIRVLNGSNSSNGVELIPLLAIIAMINFVAHISTFCRQISKEHGRMLFQAPIKGVQLIFANTILLIGVDLIFAIVSILLLTVTTGRFNTDALMAIGAIIYGTVCFMFMIISFISIGTSFIKNTALCVITVIIGSNIVIGMYQTIMYFSLYFVPYVYVSINGSSIDIIKNIINLIVLVLLGYFAGNRIDNKVDII